MSLVAVVLPLLLAAIIVAAPGRRLLALAPLASLPALAIAVFPAEITRVDWALLGLSLGVDETSRSFLLLLGSAWSAAGWFALGSVTKERRSFWLFWLLTLSAITTAFLAQHAAGFYVGYAVMTLAGYGLVIHDRTEAARRAGRVYLILGLAGEACIITGLLLLAGQLGNFSFATLPASLPAAGATATALLLAGFAVKMGALGVHVWLPLAHPVAPVPASAILSGVIVKAGLLGWIRFLPPEALPGLPSTTLLIILGLLGAVYAALMALTQTRPKVILAWSTVSQLGLFLVIFAVSLESAQARALLLPVLLLWVLHHGLNKAALFLAVGCAPLLSRWRTLLLALPALSLAGLPMTSGALAKDAVKAGFAAVEAPDWLITAFSLTSVTTTLLLVHLYRRLAAARTETAPAHPAWVLLTLGGLAVPWWWVSGTTLMGLPALSDLWSGLWPIVLAVGLALAWQRWHRAAALRLPEDEMLALGRWLGPRLRSLPDWPARMRLPWPPSDSARSAAKHLLRLEAAITSMALSGSILVLLGLLIWLSLTGCTPS